MLTDLVTAKVATSLCPRVAYEVRSSALGKPRRDASFCESKRLISLVFPLMKMAEAAAYNRIAHYLGSPPHPLWYSFRGARCADIHLAESAAFFSGHLASGRFGYLAGLDMDGASDTVPHYCLLATLWATQLGAHEVRLIGEWLRNRNFRTRLIAPGSKFASFLRPTSRGLSQGGIPSPLVGIILVAPCT